MNAVAPAPIARAERSARRDTILYLGEATFVTGETVHVDGGRGRSIGGSAIVVDAGRRELPGLDPHVDGHPGLRRQLRPAPATTLYSSAHARPSSIVQCSSGFRRRSRTVLVEGAQAVAALWMYPPPAGSRA